MNSLDEKYLDGLNKTLKEFNISNQLYCIGGPSEECVCMEQKEDGKWKTYIYEKGNEYDVRNFETIKDACLNLFECLAESAEEKTDMTERFIKNSENKEENIADNILNGTRSISFTTQSSDEIIK